MADKSNRPPTVDDRIAASTLELLRTKGPTAVTIDGVAAHSGVARTTIYRRFNDRSEMLTAALRSVTSAASPAPDATRPERLRAAVESAGALLFDGIGCGGIAALLTDADPAFTDTFRRLVLQHHDTIAASVTDDEPFGPGLTVETLADIVVGTLVAEHARTGTIADDWADRMVALLTPIAEQ